MLGFMRSECGEEGKGIIEFGPGEVCHCLHMNTCMVRATSFMGFWRRASEGIDLKLIVSEYLKALI
jgi:hypothetical protein